MAGRVKVVGGSLTFPDAAIECQNLTLTAAIENFDGTDFGDAVTSSYPGTVVKFSGTFDGYASAELAAAGGAKASLVITLKDDDSTYVLTWGAAATGAVVASWSITGDSKSGMKSVSGAYSCEGDYVLS